MNKHFYNTLILILVAVLFLVGCVSKDPLSGPITLTDGLGREVTLSAPAQKIVSLAPSNTEILFALGAGSQVIGRDEFSDYPAEAKALPSVGGSFGEYSPEAILALQPDLVLAAEINTSELVESLENLGLTVFYLSNPKDLEGMYSMLTTVGTLTGRIEAAGTLVDSLKSRVAAVDQAVQGSSDRPLVYYELDNTDPNAPYTAGPGTFVDLLIQRAGGRSVGSSLSTAWAQISAEELIAQDPEIILLGDSAYGVTPESVGQRAGWDVITAVQDGYVYPFDDNLVSRPGPRLVDGLEQLAKLIHPELFE